MSVAIFEKILGVKKSDRFTGGELLKLKPGTLVKIADGVHTSWIWKKGGELVFQLASEADGDEERFGIKTPIGVNFHFDSYCYELIDELIPYIEEEWSEVEKTLTYNSNRANKEKDEDDRKLILLFCEDNEITFQQIQKYQLRLIKANKKIDIFPTSKKYHDIALNIRGNYKDLLPFLLQYFNTF